MPLPSQPALQREKSPAARPAEGQAAASLPAGPRSPQPRHLPLHAAAAAASQGCTARSVQPFVRAARIWLPASAGPKGRGWRRAGPPAPRAEQGAGLPYRARGARARPRPSGGAVLPPAEQAGAAPQRSSHLPALRDPGGGGEARQRRPRRLRLTA